MYIYIFTRSLLRKIIIVFNQTRGTYTTFMYCAVLQIYSKKAALSLSQQYLQKYVQVKRHLWLSPIAALPLDKTKRRRLQCYQRQGCQ